MIALKNHRLLFYYTYLISFPSCRLYPKEAANANKRHRVSKEARARFHPTSERKHLVSSSQKRLEERAAVQPQTHHVRSRTAETNSVVRTALILSLPLPSQMP